jgi:hypothetical protein
VIRASHSTPTAPVSPTSLDEYRRRAARRYTAEEREAIRVAAESLIVTIPAVGRFLEIMERRGTVPS